MVRYKGRVTPRHIDQSHPAQVEIVVPETGLGRRLTHMLAFCDEFCPDFRTRPARRRTADAMRFCFRTAQDADAFCRAFGGKRFATGRDSPG